jgi:hypothetical protein
MPSENRSLRNLFRNKPFFTLAKSRYYGNYRINFAHVLLEQSPLLHAQVTALGHNDMVDQLDAQ